MWGAVSDFGGGCGRSFSAGCALWSAPHWWSTNGLRWPPLGPSALARAVLGSWSLLLSKSLQHIKDEGRGEKWISMHSWVAREAGSPDSLCQNMGKWWGSLAQLGGCKAWSCPRVMPGPVSSLTFVLSTAIRRHKALNPEAAPSRGPMQVAGARAGLRARQHSCWPLGDKWTVTWSLHVWSIGLCANQHTWSETHVQEMTANRVTAILPMGFCRPQAERGLSQSDFLLCSVLALLFSYFIRQSSNEGAYTSNFLLLYVYFEIALSFLVIQ